MPPRALAFAAAGAGETSAPPPSAAVARAREALARAREALAARAEQERDRALGARAEEASSNDPALGAGAEETPREEAPTDKAPNRPRSAAAHQASVQPSLRLATEVDAALVDLLSPLPLSVGKENKVEPEQLEGTEPAGAGGCRRRRRCSEIGALARPSYKEPSITSKLYQGGQHTFGSARNQNKNPPRLRTISLHADVAAGHS